MDENHENVTKYYEFLQWKQHQELIKIIITVK